MLPIRARARPAHHVRRRTRKQIDSGDPKAIGKALAQVNLTYDVDSMLAVVERTAATILATANLPTTDDLFHYEPSQTPAWRRYDPNQKSEAPLQLKRLVELVEELNHDRESREGYAARMIRLAWQIREFRAQGRTDQALVLGVHLGELKMEAWMHGFWERGVAGHRGSLEGAERAWGPQHKRRAKKKELCELFEKERLKVGTDRAAYLAVAQIANVGERTVRRAVTGH